MKKLLVLAMLGAFSVMMIIPAHACYYTPGKWKNVGRREGPGGWPITTMTICGIEYDFNELMNILNTQPRGDITISLAQQLIAAKLNCAAAGFILRAYLPNLIPDAEAALCAAGGIGGNPEKSSLAWRLCDYYLDLLDDANNTPW